MVYTLGKKIGQGGDGAVFELIEEGKECDTVIKFIQGENFGIKNYIEYYILYNLKPNYITNATKIEIEENGLLKIIQKKAKMDMKKYIFENNLNTDRKKNIIHKIAKCVQYLHSLHILHGDIKLTNILIFDDLEIKLSDFNLSRIITTNNKIKNKLYTINFRPPEINQNQIDIKSDVWALGCTFYEIYYETPYFQQCNGKKFFHIKTKKELDEKHIIFNDLIEKMIEHDLKKRYDMNDVLNHEFFLNFKKEEIFLGDLLSEEKLLETLEKNMKKYSIERKKHKDIFISKILNTCENIIDKSYKKIEKKICFDKFNFSF